MITQRQLQARVRYWQKALSYLGISHWRLLSCEIEEAPLGQSDATACSWISDKYDTCRIHFAKDDLPNELNRDLDETIVHEWLHVAMRDLDSAIAASDAWMPEATLHDHHDGVNHKREGFIERLARQIVQLHGKGGTLV